MLQAAMSKPLGPSDVSAEVSVRGGLFPLMHLFPSEDDHPGLSIPWQQEDHQLQQWLVNSQAYQQAVYDLQTAHDGH